MLLTVLSKSYWSLTYYSGASLLEIRFYGNFGLGTELLGQVGKWFVTNA